MYTTVSNVKLNLLDVANYPTTDANIELFITKADVLIDAYLQSRYTVPFTITPAIVQSISTDITCYYILRSAFTNDRVEKEENSWVYEFYNKAMSFLKKLASGDMNLSSDYATNAKIISNDSDYSPIFDIDDVENWERSSIRLEDIADDRN